MEWVIIVLPYNQKSPNLGDMKNTLIKIAIIAVFLFNTSHSFAYQGSDRQKSLKNSNSADVNVRRAPTNHAKKNYSSARRVITTQSSTKEEFRKRLKS